MSDSKMQLMQATVKRMDGTQREGGGRGSNNWNYRTWPEVGHPILTFPNKSNALAAWGEKKTPVNKGTEKIEKEKEGRHSGSCGGSKEGGHGDSGRAKEWSLCLAQTL